MDFESFIREIGGEGILDPVLSYHIDEKELSLFFSDFDSFERKGREKDDPGLFFLSAYIKLAYSVLDDSIPLSIQIDTFADIMTWERWYERHTGRIGLDRINWLRHHIEKKLFRLGALQFEVPDDLPPWASCLPSPVYILHIPEGADLSGAEDSMELALEFFSADSATFITHSWLLSGELSALLPEVSRIRDFASLFTVLGYDDDRQAEERIFGFISPDPSSYPAGTSLMRNAKLYLENGGRIRSGFGYLQRSRVRQ